MILRGRSQCHNLIPQVEGASVVSLYHERKEPVSYPYTMRGRSQCCFCRLIGAKQKELDRNVALMLLEHTLELRIGYSKDTGDGSLKTLKMAT